MFQGTSAGWCNCWGWVGDPQSAPPLLAAAGILDTPQPLPAFELMLLIMTHPRDLVFASRLHVFLDCLTDIHAELKTLMLWAG